MIGYFSKKARTERARIQQVRAERLAREHTIMSQLIALTERGEVTWGPNMRRHSKGRMLRDHGSMVTFKGTTFVVTAVDNYAGRGVAVTVKRDGQPDTSFMSLDKVGNSLRAVIARQYSDASEAALQHAANLVAA